MGALIEPFIYIIRLIINLGYTIVAVEIVLYWLTHFNILQANNKYSKKVMEVLANLTKPVYDKVRAKVPSYAGFDFSPFIVLLSLIFISRLLMRISGLLV